MLYVPNFKFCPSYLSKSKSVLIACILFIILYTLYYYSADTWTMNTLDCFNVLFCNYLGNRFSFVDMLYLGPIQLRNWARTRIIQHSYKIQYSWLECLNCNNGDCNFESFCLRVKRYINECFHMQWSIFISLSLEDA